LETGIRTATASVFTWLPPEYTCAMLLQRTVFHLNRLH